MGRNESEQIVRARFDQSKRFLARLADDFVDDTEAVVAEAATICSGMIPDMAYVDDHENPMASALFHCSGILAVYLALQKRGVDVHDFGNTALRVTVDLAQPEAPGEPVSDAVSSEERFAQRVADAEASQTDPAPGEFVYEVLPGGEDSDWRMNVTSCAICHAFSQYDAMDLVPYMCASDDVQPNLGLRRAGTIALGADLCDFRYKQGGEPLRLVEQYPQQMRVDQR